MGNKSQISKQISRKRNEGMLFTRDQLADAVAQDLKGYNPYIFLTLNSKHNNVKQYQIEDKSIDFNRKIEVMIKWTKEFIVGKFTKSSVRIAVFNEISEHGNLHAHACVALTGTTTRTIEDVRRFITKKWKKLRTNDDIRQYQTELTAKQKLFNRWVGLGVGGEHFPWEYDEVSKDSIVDVRPLFNLSGALLYSDKEFMHHMRANQYCSYMLM